MGERGAAERFDAVQRSAAAVGPARARVRLRQLPRKAHHLLAGVWVTDVGYKHASRNVYSYQADLVIFFFKLHAVLPILILLLI